MAEFQKVMSELNRMCNAYGDSCGSCKIQRVKDDARKSCSNWIRYNSEEAEGIIMKWASEHPIVTNRDKFKEIFDVEYYDLLLHGYVSWLDEEYKEKKDGTEQ